MKLIRAFTTIENYTAADLLAAGLYNGYQVSVTDTRQEYLIEWWDRDV